MKITVLPFFLLILISLSGCIEIIEDLTINADRSGTYKLHQFKRVKNESKIPYGNGFFAR